jgi:thioredoxin 1
MLCSTSKQLNCGLTVTRNVTVAVRPVLCTPVIKAPTHQKCRWTPGQERSSVALRSAESAAAVTTSTPTADTATAAPQLLELTKDNFQQYLDAAGDKLVVVDFFTDWCGPCKLIYPQLVTLSAELEPAATICKFNCNQHNKELAKALGIKVAPTFHLYKNGQKVADMTGAKVDKLRALIDDHLRPKEAADAQN